MATLVIRNVEDDLHVRLKSQAAAHRRSMEEEARILLRQGLSSGAAAPSGGFGQAMRAVFEPLGGLHLPATSNELPGEPPDFSGPEWDAER